MMAISGTSYEDPMLGVMTLLVLGLVFVRKQFAYLEVLPGLYIIEAVTMVLMGATCLRAFAGDSAGCRIPRAIRTPRPLVVAGLACLVLAIAKALANIGGDAS